MKIFSRLGLLLVVGALLAAAVVIWSLRPGRYDGWIETIGTVIDHRVTFSTDSETRRTTELRAPVVQFTDESGKTFVLTASVNSSNWPAIGSNVKVRYLPGQPLDARIGDDDLFVPMFFGIWAGVLGLVGAVFLLVSRAARSTAGGRAAPRELGREPAEDTSEPVGRLGQWPPVDFEEGPREEWPRLGRTDEH